MEYGYQNETTVRSINEQMASVAVKSLWIRRQREG